MKELDRLREAIYAGRFDGRIEEIKMAFKAYKKSLERPSLLEQIKQLFKKRR